MLTSLKTFIAKKAENRKVARNYSQVASITDPRVRDEVLAMMGR